MIEYCERSNIVGFSLRYKNIIFWNKLDKAIQLNKTILKFTVLKR